MESFQGESVALHKQSGGWLSRCRRSWSQAQAESTLDYSLIGRVGKMTRVAIDSIEPIRRDDLRGRSGGTILGDDQEDDLRGRSEGTI